MQDNRNLTIGILCVTATILFVGVVLSTTGGRNEAMAIGQLDRGGDYVVVTGQFSESQELVYVTDAAAQRLNAYSYDAKIRQFTLWDSIDLNAVLGSSGK
jgi:hypothetical protein